MSHRLVHLSWKHELHSLHGAVGEKFRLLDDNASPHRASTVLNRLDELGIYTLPLASRSPDLNPIGTNLRELWNGVPQHRELWKNWQMSSLVYGMKLSLRK